MCRKERYCFWGRRATRVRAGWLKGVVVPTNAGLIQFDPQTKRFSKNSCVFISHAHSDHVRGLGHETNGYLTAETKDILSKLKFKKELNLISLRYGDEVSIDGLEITIHNSGHVLGSSQYEIRDEESSIVYTSDINCRAMLTTTAAEAIPCDTLILETTYGNPLYAFPRLSDIHISIIKWAISEIRKGRIPTFIAYSVGKAQEIVKIFNEFTKIPVVTSHSIAIVNEVYDKYGVKLKYVDSTLEEGKELLMQPCVQIVSSRKKACALGPCSFAIASGWALRYNKNSVDAAFPLSGHADFSQLVNYVKCVKPKEVFTVHGFKEYFANYISRKLGLKARAIPLIKQRSLKAFI